ncbi:MAG TPA: hypothetical protein VK688_00450, partial [Gemmatimonadales bacterium]|nr:hypothetical protein [Gemmatimonadales bacterium]
MSTGAAQPTGPSAARRQSPAMAFGCLALFALPFIAVGIGSAVMVVPKLWAGDWKGAGLLGLFALTFGGAGGWVLAAGVMGQRQAASRALAAERHPNEPWLWRPDWAAGSIEDAGRKSQYFLWAFAAFWNLIAWPIGVMVVRATLIEGNRLGLLGLLFPIVGIGLLVAAIRATLRERKFGVSVLELA